MIYEFVISTCISWIMFINNAIASSFHLPMAYRLTINYHSGYMKSNHMTKKVYTPIKKMDIK